MSEEREFEVIDKRRVSAEGTAAEEQRTEPGGGPAEPAEAGAGAAEQGLTEEELRAALEEAAEAAGGEMPELSVPGALRFCIETLQGLAWIKMGLVAAPGSGTVQKDLPEAKVAIDAVGDLVTRLNPFVSDGERRELQTVLANLRINFVQKSQPS